MASNVQYEMATRIAIDTVSATGSLKGLKDAVSAATNAWKAQEVALKSSGDAIGAAQAKFNGLGDVIDRQKAKINELKTRQEGLDTSTQKGAESYLKLQKQIDSSTKQLSSLESQQERAKSSMNYYTSGLADLQKGYRQASELSKSYIDRLEAEGRTEDANRIKLSNYKQSLSNLSEQYSKQEEELKRIASESSTTSEAYQKQKIRLNETATSMAKVRSESNELRESMNKVSEGNFLNGVRSKLDSVNEKAEKTSNLFGKIVAAHLVANGIQNGLQIIKAHFSSLIDSAKEYDVNLQKMQATWLTLTGTTSKAKDMVNTINELATKTGQATDTVDELEQGFYHLHSSKKESDELTKSMLNMSDAVGLNSQQIQAVTQDMVNGLSRGKANAGMLNQISQYFPMFREQLAKYETKLQSTSKTATTTGQVSSKAVSAYQKKLTLLFEQMHYGTTNSQKDLEEYKEKGIISASQLSTFQKQLSAGTKVTNSEITQAIKVNANAMAQQDAQTSKTHKNSKVTVADLSEMAKQGKISAKDIEATFNELGSGKYNKAADNMLQTMYGMDRTIKAQMPKLVGDIYQPIMNMKNPLIGKISKWTTDSETQKEFKTVGNTLANEINKIINAFGGKNLDVTRSFDGALQELNKGIKDVGDSIIAHKNDIKAFGTTIGETTVTTWKVFGDVLKDLEPVFKIVGGIAASYPKQFADMIAYTYLAHKAFGSFATVVRGVSGGLKAVQDVVGAIKWIAEATGIKATTSALKEQNIVLAENVKLNQEETGASTVSEVGNLASGGVAGKTGEAVSAGETVAKDAEGSLSRSSKIWSGLGTNLAGRLISGATIAFTAWDAGSSIFKAFNSNSAQAKYSAAGKTTGALVGGGVGAALGSVIPGAGTAAGAILGSSIGEGLGSTKTASSIAEKFTKSLSGEMNKKTVLAPKISMKSAYDKLNNEAKEYYSKKQKQDEADIKVLYKNGDLSKEEYQKRLNDVKQEGQKANALEKMSQSDRNAVLKYYSQSRQKLESSYDEKIRKDKVKWNNIVQADIVKYGASAKQTRDAEHKQELAMEKDKNAKKEALQKQSLKFSTQVTADEAKLHTTLNGKIQAAANQQTKILDNLNKNKGKLSQQQLRDAVDKANKEYNETVSLANKEYNGKVKAADNTYNSVMKAANRQQNEAIKAANDQYKQTVSAAENQFKGNSKWAEQQRADVKKKAEDQRNSAVNAAFDQYNKTKDHAEKQYQGVTTAAEKQRSETKAKAEKQRDAVNGAAESQSKGVLGHAVKQANGSMEAQSKQGKGTTSIWSAIAKWWNGLAKDFGVETVNAKTGNFNYSTMSMPAYATGTGQLSKSQLALVGEEGAELAYKPYSGSARILGSRGAELANLEAGEMILNASDTKAVISGSYGGKLPAYSSGTIGISDFIKKAELGATSIWNNVSDAAMDAISKITDPVKILTNIADSTFNLASIPNVGSVAQGFSKGLVKKSIDAIGKVVKKLIDSFGSQSSPSGTGVQRWKGQVVEALKANGLSTSLADKVLRQINTESGGNEKAKQAGADPDGDGSGPAIGLMQTKMSTFLANAFSGHKNIYNGYDNLLAALHYAKARYGSNLSALGNGHGYANGGAVSTEGLYTLAEGNKTEYVIPTDLNKHNRAVQLLDEAKAAVGVNDDSSDSSDTLNRLNDKFDTLLDMFGQLLGLSGAQLSAIKAGNDPTKLYQRMAMDQNAKNYQTFGG